MEKSRFPESPVSRNPPDVLLLLAHIVVLLVLVFFLGHVVLNVVCFDGLRPVPAPRAEEAPLVSILVPARNEALNIERCVRSLLAQDYPRMEIIVLDDHSTDGTGALARALGLGEGAGSEGRVVLAGADLPAGWAGKNWACHQLSQRARGEFLFFTDADTEHAAGTVSAAVAYAREKRADLVSAWPRLVTVTWGEKLVIPIILLVGMTLYPHALLLFLQARPRLAARVPLRWRRSLGAANGQFMFFTRAGYERIGGHAALRDHLVEDVALGRAVAARMGEGMRLFNCESLRFSTCRMYRSFGEVWDGFSKNVRPAFEGHLAGFLAVGIMHFSIFVAPFAAVFCAPRERQSLAWIEVALVYLIRAILTARFQTSWLGCALHPLGQILAMVIGLNSWRLSAGGRVQWKGRIYRPSL